MVVVHDAIGYGPDNESTSARIATAGFVAITPNLYSRGGRARCVTRVFRELLTQRGRTMYAELDGRDKIQVVAADMNTFVAMDRSMKLNLNRNIEGEVRGDVLLASPAAMAGLPAAPVLLTFGAQ